jgi:ubiquinone/menaquinone biosynthesis C-methylase UbiE
MPDASPSSAPTDLRHRVFSRFYARMSVRMEAEGMAGLRAELLAGLTGRVVEVGAGNGMNFVHYPDAVSEVVAVEPEPYLRNLAVQVAAAAPVRVTVTSGRAERLPLPDDSVDAAVLCLVMCSLPDQAAALGEVRRVLRPGGTLRFLEHTIAPTPGLRAVQRIADATVWPLLAGGCHTATDPVGAITRAGFEIAGLRRLRFPDIRFTQPFTPHVLGTARIPGQPRGN